MRVPSEAQFNEAMRAIALPLPVDLLEKLTWDALLDDNQAQKNDLATELVAQCLSNYNQAKRLPALEWLKNDALVRLARKRVFRDFNLVSTDEYALRLRERVLRLLRKRKARRPLNSQLRWHVAQTVIDQTMPTSVEWQFGLLWALREYHYSTDLLEKFSGIRSKVRSLEKKALIGIQALRELEDLGWAIDDYKERPTRGYGLNEVEMLVARALEACPVKRLDETARERLLAYRLWEVCHTMRRGHRAPGAIHYILSMQGIANQIDERTIERMCTEFRQQRRGHGIPTRRLFAELRGDNYRDEIRRRYDDNLQEEKASAIG